MRNKNSYLYFSDLQTTPLTEELLRILKKKLIKNLYKSHVMITELTNRKGMGAIVSIFLL